MAIKIDESSRVLIAHGTKIHPRGLGYMYEYKDCAGITLPALRRAIAKLEDKEIPPARDIRTPDGSVVAPEDEADSLLDGVTNHVTFCMPEEAVPEFITLDVNSRGDMVTSFYIPTRIDDPSRFIEAISPHVIVRHARIIQFKWWEDPGPGIAPGWDIDLLINPRGKVSDVLQLASVLAEVLRRPSETLGPEMVLGLCHGGAPEALIGLRESEWLEVKSEGYNLSLLRNKIELAQDVARFANSESGGILTLGYRTKKNRQGETITKLTPVLEEHAQVDRYQATIDSRVFPPIDGLKVQASSYAGGYILTILVPAQQEENKPFLVHGAIVDNKIEGAFISIVRRRGEASIPITGPAIHSMLTAGRALLRGSPTKRRAEG